MFFFHSVNSYHINLRRNDAGNTSGESDQAGGQASAVLCCAVPRVVARSCPHVTSHKHTTSLAAPTLNIDTRTTERNNQ